MAGVTPFLRAQIRGLMVARSLPQLGWTAETANRSFSQPAPAQEESRPLGHPWRIVVAVCVQRLPTLTRETTDIEKRYQQLKEQLRIERSRLSDYELEEREHMKQKRERERQALEDEVVIMESSKQSAIEEFEDVLEARQREKAEFQPGPRATPADLSNDMRTMGRQLDKMLYLLVRKDRTSHCWQMPQGALEEGESLLQGAKRELSKECGSGLRVDFLSSTPSAFHSYHHTLPTSAGIIGSKVFFLKAQYRGGEIVLNQQKLVDHIWVTKHEMKQYVTDDYFASVGCTLID